jgi:putative membrane protein
MGAGQASSIQPLHKVDAPASGAEKTTALATLRSHMANERTHLAYVRTAISLLGFGIVLNRFALYLIQSQHILAGTREPPTLEEAKWVGSGMVVLGILVLAWSIFRFHRTSRDIDRQRYHSDWRAVLVLTLFLLWGATVTTLWLFFH